MEYLAIRNWEKYQSGKKGWDWIKDYVNQNDDEDLSGLSLFERGVLQELRRVRGRSGKNIHNDVTHIARAIHAKVTDRPHLRHAIDTLVARKVLVLTNEQVGFLEEMRIEEKRVEKSPPIQPIKPPKEFTGDDLVFEVLRQIGVSSQNPELRMVVSDSLTLKSREPTWTIEKAALHFIERGTAYKSSPLWNTKYKTSWLKWFQNQCYDQDPRAWAEEAKNGKQSGWERTLQNFRELELEERSAESGSGNGAEVSRAKTGQGKHSGPS